ncbi:MAG: hypothetical protein KY434_02360 [Actinobacteria bacterium]|nr:hypothetical protein [Actinomycetota bacterium]
MGIGASIFLIALGAIFAFAVEYELAGIDIQVVGLVLMLAGLIGLVMTFTLFRRRDVVVRETPPAEREVIRERDRRDPGAL